MHKPRSQRLCATQRIRRTMSMKKPRLVFQPMEVPSRSPCTMSIRIIAIPTPLTRVGIIHLRPLRRELRFCS